MEKYIESVENSLIDRYTELYSECVKKNEDQLTLISIHLLHLRLVGFNYMTKYSYLHGDLIYDITETIQNIERMSLKHRDYVNEILSLHQKFSKLLTSLKK